MKSFRAKVLKVDRAGENNQYKGVMRTNLPHVCGICSEGFSSPQEIEKHMRVSYNFLAATGISWENNTDSMLDVWIL